MHLLAILTFLLLAIVATAIPTNDAIAEPITEDLRLCVDAPNCEVFTLPDGTYSIRFVAGMEPGSAWYAENANLTDPTEHGQPSGIIRPRQSIENCQDGVCTNIWISPGRGEYGTAMARDVADSLWDNCHNFSCDIGREWSFPTKSGTSGSAVMVKNEVKVSAKGVYDPSIRWPLIWSITEVVGELQQSEIREGGRAHWGSAWQGRFWTGPRYIHIARFNNRVLQGDIAVEFQLGNGWDGGCDIITGLAGTLVGRIVPVAGEALGQLSVFCK